MIELTRKEQEALLILYKGVNIFYSANSLSKELGITQVGAMKLLKRLEKEEILVSKTIGKSIVYKINVEKDLVQKIISFILANQSNNYQRWKEDFKELNKPGRIVLFYGSASRNYKVSKDIDIMIIHDKKETKDVHKTTQKIQGLLPKKLHVIEATKEEIIAGLKSEDRAIMEIIRTAIVLYGYDNYVEVLNDFQKF